MQLTEGAMSRVVLGAVILYLAAHGVTGRQGLVSYMGLQARERALAAESADLAAQIDALSKRADRLRTGGAGFDRDYLEERARTLIDAVAADETVLELAALPGSANAGQP